MANLKLRRLLVAILLAGLAPDITYGQVRTPKPARLAERIRRVEEGLTWRNAVRGKPHTRFALQDRMRHYQVPGVSLAVIEGGQLSWARAYGIAQSPAGQRVAQDTLFQAGSVSKPIAALIALRLVAQGQLRLDEDINQRLQAWKIPASQLVENQPITLRHLLSHTAGLNVHGFAGYTTAQPQPTLLQILRGTAPANSPAIRVEQLPGQAFRYSGGGYVVLQQLLFEVTGQPFFELANQEVFKPIQMRHSTYEQPPPPQMAKQVARGHDAQGTIIPGGWHHYPEMAAAGLWSTASDLAQIIIHLQQALQEKPNALLPASLAKEMLTPNKAGVGLGFFLGGSGQSEYFMHDGATEGFQALVVGFKYRGQGAVILTNSNRGLDLAYEILRALAIEYQWLAFAPLLKDTAVVASQHFRPYVGLYRAQDGERSIALTISLKNQALYAESTYWQGQRRLYPRSATQFFTLEGDWEFEFLPHDDLVQFGPLRMKREGH